MQCYVCVHCLSWLSVQYNNKKLFWTFIQLMWARCHLYCIFNVTDTLLMFFSIGECEYIGFALFHRNSLPGFHTYVSGRAIKISYTENCLFF